MKKISCTLFLLVFLTMGVESLAQDWTGRWWLGILSEAGLPLNLNIVEQDGKPWAVFYSPAQSKSPMPTTKSVFSGDTLRYESKSLQLKMRFVYDRESDSWRGRFTQGLLSSEMVLSPTDTLYQMRRPQEESIAARTMKYYDEHEVVVQRKRAGVTLAGTLSMPVDVDPWFSRKGPQPKPAVVLVNGSGQQNRDSELMGHRPFAVLADYLAERGIAVLRYDDRGVGGSKGEVNGATTMDFADDAEAMMEWLRKQPGIDPKRVGIVGHSEGGLIASIVASRNRHARFAVLLAGPGCSGRDVLIQQSRALLTAMGMDSALVERRQAIFEAYYDDPAKADSIVALLSKDERKALNLEKPVVAALKMQLELPWMKAFLTTDPSVYLRKVRCPMLAINGDKDLQVLAEPNLKRIKQLVPQAELRLMPGLNHLMQHATTGSPTEYMLIEETMSEEVMAEVERFVKKQ